MRRAFIVAALLLAQAVGAHAGAIGEKHWGPSASADRIIAQSDPSGRLRQKLAHGGFGGLFADMMRRMPTDAEIQAQYRWSRIHDPVGTYNYEEWTQPGS